MSGKQKEAAPEKGLASYCLSVRTRYLTKIVRLFFLYAK